MVYENYDKMDIRKSTNSYMERWDTLVSKITGNTDIYDYHLNVDTDKEHIVEDKTKGSVRLQMGMVVSVPESEKMEDDFINLVMP